MEIREYKPSDRKQVEHLIAELQDYEANMVQGMLPGKQMATVYLQEAILKDCAEKDGKIWMAEKDGKLVGFIWVRIESEPRYDLMYEEPEHKFLYIGDFVVLNEFRGQGIGKALVMAVENYAKEIGIDFIETNVTAKNYPSRDIYQNLGFQEEWIRVAKKLK